MMVLSNTATPDGAPSPSRQSSTSEIAVNTSCGSCAGFPVRPNAEAAQYFRIQTHWAYRRGTPVREPASTTDPLRAEILPAASTAATW